MRSPSYAAFKSTADEVGALTMTDVSHYGGLVAANVMRNPLDAGFDVMTTTSHKTLRGPRGGIILCRKEHAGRIDASVFPGLQGGPHMNVVAGTAVTLKKAAGPDFQAYARRVLRNAKVLADALMKRGMKLVTDGTDNHMMVIDTASSVGAGRPRRRGRARCHRHHHEQASHSGRSAPAAQTEWRSP